MCVYVWFGFCMDTAEDPSLRFFATMHVKDQFLKTSLERLLRTPSDRISHRIHIISTSCCQLSAKSGIFCFLLEVVYWPCSKKFVYPTINLVFLGIILKVKLLAKFWLYSFEWFCLQIRSDAKYFFLLSKPLRSRINSCYSILFSNLK